MGLNKPFDRALFVMGGAVKQSGGSLKIANGELAIIDQTRGTPEGSAVVTTFAGKKRSAKDFVLTVGVPKREPNRSTTNRPDATMPFSLDEIRSLRVSVPEITEQKFDDVIIGYDGITPGSGFKFVTGDAYLRLSLELKSDALAYKGGGGNVELINVNVEIPACDPFNTCVDCDPCGAVDCRAITEELIRRLKSKQKTGGDNITKYVDITPVYSCDNDVTATLIPYNYYTLEVCDSGSEGALALVAAQYPDYEVRVINRRGALSTYEIFIPTADGAPDDYEQTIASLIMGCKDCPAGYTEVFGGMLYAFTIEDDGTDATTLFTAIPHYAAGTIRRGNGHEDGRGVYTAVFTQKLTQAEIDAFIAGAAPRNTATVDFVSSVAGMCTNDDVLDTPWVIGDTCNAIENTYEITLPDTACGEDRLAELNTAYPNLTITITQRDTVNSTRTITLTGTSGTADITVGGTPYTATYATSLTVTANNFVTAHSATIFAASGVTVTALTGVLTFTGPTATIAALAIANTAPNLSGTLGTASVITEDFVGGCQTRYSTTVLTNIVCDECDPIYLDSYMSEAPESYENHMWALVADDTTFPNGNCQCGIRFRGKPFVLDAEEALRDQVGFIETSTQIQVAAGYPDEIREGIGRLPTGTYPTVYLEYKQDRTHLGGNLLDMEAESRAYFRNIGSPKDYLGRVLRGETSRIEDQRAQYVQYVVSIASSKNTQGFAGRLSEEIEYSIFVEVGRHNAVENLLNNLAAAAGIPGVQAFGA